jgi:hypothetical protein
VISAATLNLISSFIIFTAALIPIYFSMRLSKIYKKLALALSIFIVLHGVYHLFEYMEYEFLAESILSPLSIIILIVFGLLLLSIASSKRKEIKFSK